MKEYLIVSDTHGFDNRLLTLVYDHPEINGLIFLGDGMSDLACVRHINPDLVCYAVKGNCDFCGDVYHGISCPDERILNLDGHKLMLCHGHYFGAKSSTAHLLAHGRANHCEAVLFGHSHVPFLGYESEEGQAPCYLFNPGSLGRPADGKPSYGILQIHASGLLFSHGKF